MRFAKDSRTGRIVAANGAMRSAFYCPTCGGRVSLRAGTTREAHFAHYAGEGSRDCEEYRPGILDAARDLVEPKGPERGCEDRPEFLGLTAILDGDMWTLFLRLPEILNEDLEAASLNEFTRARVEVFYGSSKIRTVPALELLPAVGIARAEVPPTLQHYQCQATGQWPDGINLGRWTASLPGLSAAGSLFCLRSGEWTRLRARSLVQWGESLLLVADHRFPPPEILVRKAVSGHLSQGTLWRLWHLLLPQDSTSEVEVWLKRLGYEVQAPSWRVRLLSVPLAYDETGPQFKAGTSLLVELYAPVAATSASVAVTLGTKMYTTPVFSPENLTVYGKIHSNTAAVGLLEIGEGGQGNDVSFEFIQPEEVHSERDSPRLRVRIGSQVWEPWSALLTPRAEQSKDVEVDTGIDGARLDLIVWNRHRKRLILSHATSADVVRVLREALPEAELVEIDGGNLGRVMFRVGSAARSEPGDKERSRLAGWFDSLTASTTMRADTKSIPYLTRRGTSRPSVGWIPSWLSPLVRARERKLK